MRPDFALNNHANQRMTDGVLSGNCAAFLAFCKLLSNLLYFLGIQLACFVALAFGRCAMPFFVVMVAQWRVISQVIKPVVGRIAIVVTNLHALWARPDKSQHYKLMHSGVFGFLVFAKSYLLATEGSIALLQNAPEKRPSWRPVLCVTHAGKASHVSKVRDLVKLFVARNGLPDFFHVVAPSNAPSKIHGSQWSDWFSGANLAMNPHCKAQHDPR